MLSVENIAFSYGGHVILEDISFMLQKGKILGILGPNGTGKTTLLKCLAHILEVKTGRVIFDGLDMYGISPKQRARIMGYVPQSEHGVFFKEVVDTVMMGRIPFMGFAPSKTDRNIAFEILELMGLVPFAFRGMSELSGGERQRVLIARALAQEPKLLLLDEPTSSLDLKNQLLTLRIVRSLVKDKNLTAVMTIHDLNLAAMFCNEVLMLNKGSVFAHGDCKKVITTENVDCVYGVKTHISLPDGVPHARLLDAAN
jgi:iron complex transport system ATP-binding protein